jgi:hypothetical protein
MASPTMRALQASPPRDSHLDYPNFPTLAIFQVKDPTPMLCRLPASRENHRHAAAFPVAASDFSVFLPRARLALWKPDL